MTKVYPNASIVAELTAPEPLTTRNADADAVVLTVWKKSLLFNCNGFTVFDAKGNLVFRVDNYISGNRGEIVLMDASGKSLFTIRRKRLSFGSNWMVFEGENCINPSYSMKKQLNFLNNKCLAHVSSRSTVSSVKKNKILYEIEGSYAQRCCAVFDDRRRRVAEIKQKEAAVKGVAFGMDVFRLIVHSEPDLAVAMAFVIILDQMFGSSTSP